MLSLLFQSDRNKTIENMNDVTECSICQDVFKQPKILTCIHTFCLGCLQKHGGDKVAGNQLACPLCRKEFMIPDGGFANIQSNIFIEKLLEVNKICNQSPDETKCDICCSHEDDDDEQCEPSKMAKTYCVDCHQNLCVPCTNYHRRVTSTKLHQLLTLGNPVAAEELANSGASFCQQHQDQRLTIHCNNCKVTICMTCSFLKHKDHICADVGEVADLFRAQIVVDVGKIDECIKNNKAMAQQLKAEKAKFEELASKTEAQVSKRGEELELLVKNHTKATLQVVTDLKKERVKIIETSIDDVERHVVILEGFRRYSMEVKGKGTPSDTACSANSLHVRAEELEALGVIGAIDDEAFQVDFANSTFDKKFSIPGRNLVGIVTKKCRGPSIDYLSVIATTGQAVCGITCLDGALFVVRQEVKEIQEYEEVEETFTVKRTIQIISANDHTLHTVVDMASCSANKCFYIADSNYTEVHKVDLNGNLSCWSLDSKPIGISVNSRSNNVLITLSDKPILYEYAADGSKAREISLEAVTITKPLHAAQLTNGQFIILDGEKTRICLVGADGSNLVKEYDGTYWRSGHNTHDKDDDDEVVDNCCLDQPTHLVATRNGYVISTVQNTNQVLKLSPKLKYPRQVCIPNGSLDQPCRLCLDSSLRVCDGAKERLYVAEKVSGKILVFDITMGDEEHTCFV